MVLTTKMGKVTSTSIRMDEDLWREAKKYAIDHDMTVSELVEKGLRNEMKNGQVLLSPAIQAEVVPIA